MKLFYQIWHIHKIFDLHAFLLKAHGALKPYWASQLTLLYFNAQVPPGSGESIRGGKDSVFSRLLEVEFFLYSSLALLLYRRNQDVLNP